MEKIPLVMFPLETAVHIGFYAVLFLYVVFSLILYYHWYSYSVNALMTNVTLILYTTLTLPLVIVLSLLTFTTI